MPPWTQQMLSLRELGNVEIANGKEMIRQRTDWMGDANYTANDVLKVNLELI